MISPLILEIAILLALCWINARAINRLEDRVEPLITMLEDMRHKRGSIEAALAARISPKVGAMFHQIEMDRLLQAAQDTTTPGPNDPKDGDA